MKGRDKLCWLKEMVTKRGDAESMRGADVCKHGMDKKIVEDALTIGRSVRR